MVLNLALPGVVVRERRGHPRRRRPLREVRLARAATAEVRHMRRTPICASIRRKSPQVSSGGRPWTERLGCARRRYAECAPGTRTLACRRADRRDAAARSADPRRRRDRRAARAGSRTGRRERRDRPAPPGARAGARTPSRRARADRAGQLAPEPRESSPNRAGARTGRRRSSRRRRRRLTARSHRAVAAPADARSSPRFAIGPVDRRASVAGARRSARDVLALPPRCRVGAVDAGARAAASSAVDRRRASRRMRSTTHASTASSADRERAQAVAVSQLRARVAAATRRRRSAAELARRERDDRRSRPSRRPRHDDPADEHRRSRKRRSRPRLRRAPTRSATGCTRSGPTSRPASTEPRAAPRVTGRSSRPRDTNSVLVEQSSPTARRRSRSTRRSSSPTVAATWTKVGVAARSRFHYGRRAVDVDRQIELLTAGAVDVISEAELRKKLETRPAAAGEARHRPDRLRHPSRLRGRAAPAAPLPGSRPRRRC